MSENIEEHIDERFKLAIAAAWMIAAMPYIPQRIKPTQHDHALTNRYVAMMADVETMSDLSSKCEAIYKENPTIDSAKKFVKEMQKSLRMFEARNFNATS